MKLINKKVMMKQKTLFTITSLLCICLGTLLIGCDLELQKGSEFDSGIEPQVTFGEMTAWERLQTNPNDEFDYMIEAIELTGLQAEYNSLTAERTFFLVKNLGFTHNAGILKLEFGSASIPLEDVDVDKLRNIMKYYILDTYVDQGPDNLVLVDTDYPFNTLSEDINNSYLTIQRNWSFNLRINYSEDIASDTKKSQSVKLHNYIFSNGNAVGHIMERHIRLAPFQ